MTRVEREIRMWERFYLEGAAYRYRLIQNAGKPDWDLASIAAPHAALLFALDLAYREQLEARRRERIRFEKSFDLDPARSDIAGGVIRSGVLRCDEGAPVRYAIIGTAADPKGSYAINEWVYDSDDTGGGRKLEDSWRSNGPQGSEQCARHGRCCHAFHDTAIPRATSMAPSCGFRNPHPQIYLLRADPRSPAANLSFQG